MSALTYSVRPHPRTLHTVLPSGSTTLERALVYAYDAQPVPTVIEGLNDALAIDTRLLDAMAYARSADNWQISWTDAEKREQLARALSIQARTGTLWAMREVLRNIGQGDAEIVERVGEVYFDGDTDWDDGLSMYDDDGDGWAKYAIILKTQVTDSVARWIIDAVQRVAPARCHLTAIVWGTAIVVFDADFNFDSDYTFEAVIN